VNRRNLKFINFEHTLYPELGLEINNIEVAQSMRMTLGANSKQYEQENFRKRGEGRNKSSDEDQHK
jgi:hypothetical protein